MTARERHPILEEDIRTDAPGTDANNNDVFVWALYLLGGASKTIDVEQIYLKAFEIAPLRFGWRTRPDIPNFKKTSKALQAIEAKTHVGLLQKLGANTRRLTPAGVAWVEAYKPLFELNYGESKIVKAPATSEISRQSKDLHSSEAWKSFKAKGTFKLGELARACKCSIGSSDKIWQDRFADFEQLAALTKDQEIADFLTIAKNIYKESR